MIYNLLLLVLSSVFTDASWMNIVVAQNVSWAIKLKKKMFLITWRNVAYNSCSRRLTLKTISRKYCLRPRAQSDQFKELKWISDQTEKNKLNLKPKL